MKSDINEDPSQCALILTLLTERAGEWVPMPEIGKCSGASVVHSRIAELRAKGFRIDNRVDRTCRPKKSFYRLNLETHPVAHE